MEEHDCTFSKEGLADACHFFAKITCFNKSQFEENASKSLKKKHVTGLPSKIFQMQIVYLGLNVLTCICF